MTEQDRLAQLAKLGVPMVEPEQPPPDLIGEAAQLLSMTREAFCTMFAGVGEESLEQRARRIVGRQTVERLLDRGIADPPREPKMNFRGRWRFPR